MILFNRGQAHHFLSSFQASAQKRWPGWGGGTGTHSSNDPLPPHTPLTPCPLGWAFITFPTRVLCLTYRHVLKGQKSGTETRDRFLMPSFCIRNVRSCLRSRHAASEPLRHPVAVSATIVPHSSNTICGSLCCTQLFGVRLYLIFFVTPALTVMLNTAQISFDCSWSKWTLSSISYLE